MKSLLRKIIPGLLLMSLLSSSVCAQGRLATVDLRKVFEGYWKTKKADAQLKERGADVILYACTSGSFMKGPEYERHIITKPCILYIPRGFEHNPMDIKRVGKPLLFMPLHLAPYFNGYYQTGYMQFLSHEKID